MPISIKISEENYEKLSDLSGRLRQKLKKPVSINDAISYLYKTTKLSDLAGSWKMSDMEADDFIKSIRKDWKKWATKSV